MASYSQGIHNGLFPVLTDWRYCSVTLSHRFVFATLHWRHNDPDGVSNHQPHGCLPKRFFTRRSKKISKLRVTGLCAGNSPETGEFPAQMASNAENVSIWWRHHVASYHIAKLRWRWLLKSFPRDKKDTAPAQLISQGNPNFSLVCRGIVGGLC